MAQRQPNPLDLEPGSFYRATDQARRPGVAESLLAGSLRMHDVLELCQRGAWVLQLRQCMPPMSLRESLARLVEMGLVELVNDPPAMPALDAQRRFLPSRRQAANDRMACAQA